MAVQRFPAGIQPLVVLLNTLVVLTLLLSPLGPALASSPGSGGADLAPVAGPPAPAAGLKPLLLQDRPTATPSPTEPSPGMSITTTATVTLTPTIGPVFTPTLSPTSTATITPAPGLTPTLTPPPTLTPTVTPTPTIAPALTPTPTLAPLLSLSKEARPTLAAPEQVVTFTLAVGNAGDAPARDLLLRDVLPEGLTYLRGSAPDADYDPEAGTLTWQLAEVAAGKALTLTLAATVAAQPGEELTNTGLLEGGGDTRPLTATATVYVADATSIEPDTGGVLRSADGRVAVYFPPGAVERPIEASHRPLPPLDLPPDQHIFYRFELDAWEADRSDLPVTDFLRAVTVTLTYSDTEVAGLVEGNLRLVHWDEESGAWTPISTTVDVENNLLTAQVSHFSVFGASGDEEVFFLPRIEAGQVSLLTGDSSFSYDLEIPAGAGGLKVPLTLQYNGGIPNGLTKPLIGPDTNSDTGWVGVGWSFDVGRFEDEKLAFNSLSTAVKVISAESGGTDTKCSPKGCTPGPSTPWCICESGSLTDRQHRTSDVQFYKIESERFVGPRIDSLDQVDVWTKDGTHYIFGSEGYVPFGTCSLPSGQVECGTGSRLYATRNNGDRVYLAYKLDTIVDPHGNQVKIEYVVFPKPGSNHQHLKESYPGRILYTTNDLTGDDHAEYEIEFDVDVKAFDKKWDKKVAETRVFLNDVNVWFHYDPDDPDNWATKKVLVRQYRFDYNSQLITNGTAYELASIVQYAPDQVQYLPPTIFGYTPRTIGWRINGHLGGNWHTVNRRFLQTADNGYGGTLTFGYTDWNCYDYDSATTSATSPLPVPTMLGAGCLGASANWYRVRACRRAAGRRCSPPTPTTRRTSSGRGTRPPVTLAAGAR